MQGLELNKSKQQVIDNFTRGLRSIYADELVSVILYGSASSGEFVYKHSDLNLLVVLKDDSLENLGKCSKLINKWAFRFIRPVFFTEGYINSANDVFPIEFLDMKENYKVLSGKDVLKDLSIDTKNLRFQCEQELRVKLIALKQIYLRGAKGSFALKQLLFKSFTSVVHILRNVLRLKGKQAPYLKSAILKEAVKEFELDAAVWEKILAAKNKEIKLGAKELELIFAAFVKDLEKLVTAVDRF